MGWVVWVVVFYWLLWFTGGWILCMLLDFVGVCGVIGYGFCHFVVDAAFLVSLLVLIDGVFGFGCMALLGCGLFGGFGVVAILWLLVWVVVLLFCGLVLLFRWYCVCDGSVVWR